MFILIFIIIWFVSIPFAYIYLKDYIHFKYEDIIWTNEERIFAILISLFPFLNAYLAILLLASFFCRNKIINRKYTRIKNRFIVWLSQKAKW